MGLSPFFTDEKAGAEAPAAAWGYQGGFPGSWDLYPEGQAGAGQVISGVKGQIQDEETLWVGGWWRTGQAAWGEVTLDGPMKDSSRLLSN